MSASDSFQRESQDPAGLSLNLSSNNPFRNRTASPASPASPFDDPPSRPQSRNPFIDFPPPPVKSPGAMSNNSDSKSLSAEEIFNSLTLEEKKGEKPLIDTNPAPSSGLSRPTGPAAPRIGENVPPPEGSNRPKPTLTQDEAMRARRMQGPPRPGPSGSPGKRPPPQQRRPRRNSDSSVRDFDNMQLTEEEKRIIARRRERERQRREGRGDGEARESRDKSEVRERREGREGRESKDKEGREGKEGKSRSKSGRPNRRYDVIDQLDATGIYGTGLFHHDGPFDALNPHRNRNAARRAPMQAFPKDSLNNSIGGSGPVNKVADHSTFLGQGNDEAFRDYAAGNAPRNKNGYTYQGGTDVPIFDPIARGEVIHGDESVGLGTSTFLEGTPAARTAIARNREDQVREFTEGGGLQRKKSLAQRFRGMNKGQRTPDGYGPRDVASASTAEGNPFFSDYGKGEEGFSVKPREGAMSPNELPRRGSGGAPLERRATADATMSSEDGTKPSGFLGRMKSLKGGKRPKNPNAEPTSPPPNPGTAM